MSERETRLEPLGTDEAAKHARANDKECLVACTRGGKDVAPTRQPASCHASIASSKKGWILLFTIGISSRRDCKTNCATPIS